MYQDSTSIGTEYQLGTEHGRSACTTSTTTCRGRSRTSARSTRRATRPTSSATPARAWPTIQFPSGATPLGQPVPKPKRQYDALELTLQPPLLEQLLLERQLRLQPALRQLLGHRGDRGSHARRRPASTSATAQQQAGSIARPGGNANRAWDIDEIFWDSHGNLDVLGRLPTDRPHVVKLYGSYMVPFGTQFGAYFYAGSGTPLTTYVVTANQTQPVRQRPRRHGAHATCCRAPTCCSRTSSSVGGGNKRLRLELNVLNVFNQKTTRHQFNYLNRGAGAPRASSAIDLSDVDLRKGYDYNARIQASPDGAQRLRSALRHGRPVRARHAGLLHGSLHLLSRSRGGALPRPAVASRICASIARYEGRVPTGIRPVLCTAAGRLRVDFSTS